LESWLPELEGFKGDLPLLGRALTMSALMREESRGAHMRSDLPNADDTRFLKRLLQISMENQSPFDLMMSLKRRWRIASCHKCQTNV
jgi:succinate dehydrogenase/fumarate reductase flavoprotein subunit